MIGIIWDLYQSHQIGQLDKRIDDVQASSGHDRVARDTAFSLEEKMDRLALICCALFELIQTTSGISEEQLRRRIMEVDLRDGLADGRVTPQPKKCPKCDATISPKFRRCLFCGYKDESPGVPV